MALFPGPVVPAPEPRGLRYGLLTAANGPLTLPTPHGYGGGVRYAPVSCGSAHRYPVECDDTPPAKVFDDADALVEAEPFVVYATHVCGSVGYTPAELEQKVRRRLVNGAQGAVEDALGDILTAASTILTADDPTSIRSVVGELEQWLYVTAGYGNVGHIHAPVRYAAAAHGSGVALKDGPVWKTLLGTVWVFGNYPDTLFISGQTTVWRSDDVTVPPPEQVFDRTTNEYRLIAEQEYAVAYDCHAASATFVPDVEAS